MSGFACTEPVTYEYTNEDGRRDVAVFLWADWMTCLPAGRYPRQTAQKKMRVVQVRLLADEVRDDLEHVEPYGFTSEPLDDEQPEAFAAFFSGDRSHGIVFCIADRRYRLTKLKAGEVALYDDQGQKVHLTRDGIVVHTDKQLEATVGGTLTATVSGAATLKAASVKIDAPTVELTGALKVAKLITGTGGMAISGGSGAAVTGDIKVSGGDVTADGISLQNHTHGGVQGGSGTTGKPQ